MLCTPQTCIQASSLNSHTAQAHQNSVLTGHHEHSMRMNSRSTCWTHLFYSCACSIALPDFTYTGQKIKLLRLPKIAMTEHSTKCGILGSTGPCTRLSHTPTKLAWPVCQIGNRMSLHFVLVLLLSPHLTSWEICRIQCDILRSLTI